MRIGNLRCTQPGAWRPCISRRLDAARLRNRLAQPTLGVRRAIGRAASNLSRRTAGKTAFVAATETRPGFTIGYAFEWARENGESFRSDTGLLTEIATFPFEKNWFVHVNAGWQRTQQPRENSLLCGVAIEREAVADSRLDLMAETYGAGEGSPWFALGARFHVIAERLSINGSIAIQSGGSERQTLTTIGARLAF